MKKSKLCLAICLLAGIFAPAMAQGDGMIHGIVKNHETGKGLPGIHVWLNETEDSLLTPDLPYFAVTSLDGSYAILGIAPGTYQLRTSGVGYYGSVRTIEVQEGKDVTIDIPLSAKIIELGEVSVSSLRTDRIIRQIPLPVGFVRAADINKMPSLTMPDVIASEPGVNLTRDGIWATSVNIRGLGEQRILTMVDGNRIETATDVAGALAMIDLNDVERVEVIKGAASSVYGTGAMGGVLNIVTREAYYNNTPYISGTASTEWQSVNQMMLGHLTLLTGASRWNLKVSGTYRDAGNTKTPSGTLSNSQFTDNNLSANLGIKMSDNREFKLDLQRFHATDVGIPGGKAFGTAAKVIYPKAERDLACASYSLYDLLPELKTLTAKYSIQYILRDVRSDMGDTIRATPVGKHLTNSFQLQSDWEFSDRHQLTAGIDVWQRLLSTDRETRKTTFLRDSLGNITGQKVVIRGDTPIPTSSFLDVGTYVQDELQVIPGRLKLLLGGRIDAITVNNQEAVDPDYLIVNGIRNDNPVGQKITFPEGKEKNTSWSANAGLLYTLFPDVDLSFNAARSFRSPSLEERFKYIALSSGTVRLGNPDLKPEDGWFFDAGIRIWKPEMSLTINGFVNDLANLIVEKPGIYVFNYTEDSTATDTLPALVNSNVDRALLYGVDGTWMWNIVRNVVFYSKFSFVRGVDTKDKTSLPQIPPFSDETGIRYQWPGVGSAQFSVQMAARQSKIGEGETATGGYAVYNMGLQSYPVKVSSVQLEFDGGIQNIFNRSYQNHLATNRGIVKDEPGRNFFLRMRVMF